jgi:hypothetical protein
MAFVSRIANWFVPEFIPESPVGAKRNYIKYHSTYALLKLIIESFYRTDVQCTPVGKDCIINGKTD